MKSISIHGMDDQMNKKIVELARRKGLSLNRTTKALLAESLGIAPSKTKDHRDDFAEFVGVWTVDDIKEFESATRDLDQIDPVDWK